MRSLPMKSLIQLHINKLCPQMLFSFFKNVLFENNYKLTEEL